MIDDTWRSRELPILQAVAEGEQTGVDDITTEWLLDRTGLTPDAVARGLGALLDGTYIDATDASTYAGSYFMGVGLRERGRRTTGTWPPDDAYQALIQLLEQRIADSSTDEERSRWTRLLNGMKGLARDVGTNTIASAIIELARALA
jgi:hypothetical protein